MPIVKVEFVGDGAQPKEPGLASALAEATAPVFGTAPERTWVRLNYIEPGHYAEGGGGPLPGVLPVFVTVLLAELPSKDRRRTLAVELSGAIAELTGRPAENVHIIFEPAATGRVVFGGKLVE